MFATICFRDVAKVVK